MTWILSNLRLILIFGALIFAGVAAAYIYNRGRDAERAIVVEKIQENVKAANVVKDKNRRSSDAEITERLKRWQRD